MASLASSGGADTPEPPEPGFRARSKRRRKSSSEPSPTTSATSSERPAVFAVDKPPGRTSHDVVAHVRRVLRGVKVGHAGTLDPDATGVLVLCVGRATKISSFLMEGVKEYVGVGRLGVSTDTQDASGTVVETRPVSVSPDDVLGASARFVGSLKQTPPMFSALKVGGRKLYHLARAGVEVERPQRPIEVYSFEVATVDLPPGRFTLSCSKGTYVRTLVHDLGEELGCGAHLVELARSRQAGFRRDECVSWDELLSETAAESIRRHSVTPEDALGFLPALAVSESTGSLRVGAVLSAPGTKSGWVRLVQPGGRAIGVGRARDEEVRVLYRFAVTRQPFGRKARNP